MRAAGLILAGGLGSRLGGAAPKPLVAIAETTPFEVAVERLTRRCAPILVSANEPEPYERFGLPILADLRLGHLGPLAALEAACQALASRRDRITHLVCLPGDTPFLPRDVAPRLIEGAGSMVRVAAFGDRLHPTVSLWPVGALLEVGAELDRPDTRRSFMGLLKRLGFETLTFGENAAAPGGDPFFNVNTPQDLALARHHAAAAADPLGKAAG